MENKSKEQSQSPSPTPRHTSRDRGQGWQRAKLTQIEPLWPRFSLVRFYHLIVLPTSFKRPLRTDQNKVQTTIKIGSKLQQKSRFSEGKNQWLQGFSYQLSIDLWFESNLALCLTLLSYTPPSIINFDLAKRITELIGN